MNSPRGDATRCLRSTSTWDSFSRKHTEIAVNTPVLDLAPNRKFDRELQKSMSFKKWKADGEDHPVVCNVVPAPPVEKQENKRAASPTDTQKAKLDALRAAVKCDLRRAIMKRAHSPDSAGGDMSQMLSKKKLPSYFELSQKLLSLQDDDEEEDSQDLSASGVSPYHSLDDVTLSWNEEDDDSLDDSLGLSDDGKAFLIDDLEWDELDDDEVATTPDSQAPTEYLKHAWSTQPLDSFSDGEETRNHLLSRVGNAPERNGYHFYGNKSIGKTGASFIAYSKISVPTHKSVSETDDEDEAPTQNGFGEGFLSASKKVLTSVWTWAVVVVLYAGAKTLGSLPGGAKDEEPCTSHANHYWVESNNKLEFDWDENIEFKLHTPTQK